MLVLALQTDSRGVTGVVADRARGSAPRLLAAATVARDASPARLAEALRAALPELAGGKPAVAVALGPEEIRVKRLAVPPAPVDELPPIVAMQAARDGAIDVEGLTADFVPSAAAAEGAPSVLAAWCPNETLAFWRSVADELRGRLVVLTPRALGGAPVEAPTDSVVYLCRAGDSIDFAGFAQGAPVLLRSAPVPSTGAERELRRTLLALSSVGLENAAVAPLQVGLLDPGVPAGPGAPGLSESADAAVAERAFAAAGLASRLVAGGAPLALNLADPRRPPAPRTNRRTAVLLAATAATLVAAVAWGASRRLADLDQQLAEKDRAIAAAEKDAEAFAPQARRVAALEGWRRSDVTWLDELDRLGQRLRPERLSSPDFPVESDARVTQLAATALVGGDEGGGRIDLTAVARGSSTAALEARLRDEAHPVEPVSTSESPSKDAYRYKYSAVLRAPPVGGRAEEEAE